MGLWIAVTEASASQLYHDASFVWLGLPDGTNFVMGTLVSPLGALMLVVVNVVGFLVVLYSNEYMAHEEGLPRYYAELMLFLSAMNGLVLADNYLEFILMWELVGLCSYLLIGFFWKKPSAASAAKKAFIVTRVGDVLFFLGVFILFSSLGDLSSATPATAYAGTTCPGGVLHWSCLGFTFTPPNTNSSVPFLPANAAIEASNFGGSSWLPTLAGLLILGGAAGKSAQFPLHTWLPDAMEGPTTVSALIHAATMVAAGIYLLAITDIYFGFTLTAAIVIVGIGGFTSLFAGTMGIVAPDIKRVIAYSTISQLGYMAMAVGAAAVISDLTPTYSLVNGTPVLNTFTGVAMFHLFSHAFFKALLFLTAGAVIHAVGTQDLFQMGGLRKRMPITSITMLVGALALSGIPPFSGFFSKDDLLSLTWQAATLESTQNGSPLLYVFFALALMAVFITALYIFRLWFLAFSGDRSRGEAPAASHGAPAPAAPTSAPFASSTSSSSSSSHAHDAPAAALPLASSTSSSAPSASGAHDGGHAGGHDPSWIMTVPLVVLATLAVAAGFLPLIPGVGHLLPGLSWTVLGKCVTNCGAGSSFDLTDALLGSASLAFAGLGILTAYAFWGNGKVYRLPKDSPLLGVHSVLLHKYYFDELYDGLATHVILGLARGADWVDRYIIDGTIRGIEELFSQASKSGRRLQTGIVSSYAAWVVVGLLAFLVFFLYVVPWLVSGAHVSLTPGL